MLVAFIVYVPINSGLQFIREEGLKELVKSGIENIVLMEERGEKIPELIDALAEEPNAVIGINGSDLVADYNFGTNGSSRCCYLTNLRLDFKGPYADSVFGLPTLSLLSRDGITPEKMSEEFRRNPDKSYNESLKVLKWRRVAIPSRYKNLLKNYIPAQAEILTNGRSVDVKFAEDDSVDYAIDIVVEGKKCKQLGIGMIAPIFRSDGILIGNLAGQSLFLNQRVAPLGFKSYNDFIIWFNTGREPRSEGGDYYRGTYH